MGYRIIAAVLMMSAITCTAQTYFPASNWPISAGGNGNTYQVALAPGVSWTQAKLTANGLGGHLVTITSSAENSFVFGLLSVDPALWMTVGDDTRGPWIGGTRDPGMNNWQWFTGESWGFTAWGAGQPDPNPNSIETKVHFFGNGTNNCAPTWNDLADGSLTTGFVIEFATGQGCANPYPGSMEDLAFDSGINGPMTNCGQKTAFQGDFIFTRLFSPTGSLNFTVPVVLGQLAVTGGSPTSPAGFPELHMDPSPGAPFPLAVLYDGNSTPLGPGVLSPSGLYLPFSVPFFISGHSIFIQGVVLTNAASNGFFAAANAHEIQVM